MNIKQELIIKVAQQCFSENGIKYTSIDDIVRECKISKSTFYKYFDTKENLIAEILKYSLDSFLNNAIAIDEDIENSPKEKLKEKLSIVLEYITSYRYFNSFILEDYSQINGKPILEVKNRIKSRLVKVYYSSLIDIYGEEIKPFIWELIFIIDSIIHEFNLVIRLDTKEIDKNYIVDFVIRQVELNIENLKHNEVMIQENILYKIEDKIIENTEAYLKKQFENIIIVITEKVKRGNLNNKFMEAIAQIEKEYKLENYNSLIMDAMIAYLEKSNILSMEICKLKNIRYQLGE